MGGGSREPLLVHQYVVVEFLNQCSREPLKAEAHRLLEMLLPHPQWVYVPVTEDLHDQATTRHRDRSDKAWSLTDCVSFIVMEQRGIRRALAYDHHFEQAGFEALLRRDPH